MWIHLTKEETEMFVWKRGTKLYSWSLPHDMRSGEDYSNRQNKVQVTQYKNN